MERIILLEEVKKMKNIRRKSILIAIMLVLSSFFIITNVSAEGSWTISIQPATHNVLNNSYVQVSLVANIKGGLCPVSGWEIEILNFTASKLYLNSVTEGNWLKDVGSTGFDPGTINNTAGTLINTFCYTTTGKNTSSNGTLCVFNFTTEGAGIAYIDYVVELSFMGETQPSSPVYGNITIYDDSEPEIVDNSPSTGTTGDFFLFNCTVTDDVDSAEALTVKVNWSHGSLSGNDTMAHAGGNYFTKQITLDHSISDLTYHIYANDTYPNSNYTTELSATVSDNDAPTLVSDDSLAGTTGDSYNFSLNVTDNIQSQSELTCYVNWSHDTSSSNDSMSYSAGDDCWYKVITLDHSITNLSYTFWVNDTAGNMLSVSDEQNVTDNDAPTLVDDGSDTSATTGDTFNFVVDLADNIDAESALSVVYVNYTHDSWSANLSMSYSDGSWRRSITTNHSTSNLVYFFYVEDTAGNKLQTSGDSPVSVTDNDGPTNTTDVSVAERFTDVTKIFDIDWVNISCEITDNIGITGVYLNVTHNGAPYSNASILANKTGDVYYCNTTFSTIGSYVVFMHAYDDATNVVNTGSKSFTIYHRWDQNQDNTVDINDITSITGYYAQTGSSRWIKQDIAPSTPDGEIDINDITLVTGHYGENY